MKGGTTILGTMRRGDMASYINSIGLVGYIAYI
jgi:hypothetical protein